MAQEPNTVESDAIDPGHSYHGEVFDEGPRQAATLMKGLPQLDFPTSAKNPETQAFIEQGIAQLHGFWYLEAERSFRQAAALEPELGIAYWGCAMANQNNHKRALGFIAEAAKHLESPTTRRETMYIESWQRFLKATDTDDVKDENKKKEAKHKAHELLIADIEKIIDDYPDDIEAKAFLVLQLWLANGDGVKIASHYAVDALLDQIFDNQPMHPAHHYRIHLWDNKRPKNAIDSAAKSGPSMPAVAHMWHMPGHTYSKLFRYDDAVWQQEASARVDHAHMIETRLLPDQIHNFSHNNEWMVRNLIHLGRVDDAIRHSKNLLNLPRHPKYNTYKKGSFRFGRERLLQTLTTFGLWSQLIQESEGPYLGNTGIEEADEERDAWLAVAYFMTKDFKQGTKRLRTLQRKQLDVQSRLLDRLDADTKNKETSDDVDKNESPDALRSHVKRLRLLIARVSAAAAAARGDKDALDSHSKNAKLDAVMHAQWLAMANNLEAAEQMAAKTVKSKRGEVLPMAVYVDLLWKRGKHDEAQKQFDVLCKLAHSADLSIPMFTALKPVIEKAGLVDDWRIARTNSKDVGQRPALETLGPESWQPPPALPFVTKNTSGEDVESSHWDGKPRVIIFYLGFGCLHCVEQLKTFAPKIGDFADAGIDFVAISTEDEASLSKGIEAFGEPIKIPLLADPQQDVFKMYRCWDDFESVPLHGTFLIDGHGKVRWQDIGAEPFTNVEFLLDEAKRLLSLKS